MVDYTSAALTEPSRMGVIINQVDVSAKTCSATGLKNGNAMTGINLAGQHQRMIDWPRQGEHWAITKMNDSWYLDYKMAFGNDGFQKEANPGDSVLVTDGVVLLEGSAVRLNDSTEADILGSLRAQSAALRTALFGGPTRTEPPVVVMGCSTNYTFSGDSYAGANWIVNLDTDGMVTLGTPNSVTIPVDGRYVVQTHGALSVAAAATVIARVMLGSASFASTIVAATYSAPAAAGEIGIDATRTLFLSAGSKLYWGFYCSTATTGTVSASINGAPSTFQVRYVGPR